MVFSEVEREYLQQARLGRIATVNAHGKPRVSPVGFRLNEELGVIECGGYNPTATRRWQDLQHNPNVAFVVDDLASIDPWRARGVHIRGVAELVENEQEPQERYHAFIRIFPHTIHTWGLDGDSLIDKPRVVGPEVRPAR